MLARPWRRLVWQVLADGSLGGMEALGYCGHLLLFPEISGTPFSNVATIVPAWCPARGEIEP